MEGKFGLKVGRRHQDWKTGKMKYDGDSDILRLRGTREQIEAVVKIMDLNLYQLIEFQDPTSDFGGNKIVFESKEITEWRTNKENSKKDFNERQEARVLRINALPKEFLPMMYGETKVYFERTEAKYQPTYSSSITGGNARAKYEINGVVSELYLEDFVSTNGRLLQKKFSRYLRNEELISADLAHLVECSNKVKQIIKEA